MRFCGASGRETRYAKALGVHDLINGAGNLHRFNGREVCGGNHQIEGIDYKSKNVHPLCTTTKLGWYSQSLQVWCKDPSNGLMAGFVWCWHGRRDIYASTVGILVFAPEWETIQWSKINQNFAQNDSALEKGLLWPNPVFAHLVLHISGLPYLDWVRVITAWCRTVGPPWWGWCHPHYHSHSVHGWSP